MDTVSFGMDKTSWPPMADTVGGVRVHLHHGAAFIINLLKHAGEHKVRDIMQPKICQKVVKLVNEEVKTVLASMAVTMEIGKYLLIDYRLVAYPNITADYTEI